MDMTIEQKMIQAILFTYKISLSTIMGLFDYCVFPKCNTKDLPGFLNQLSHKHILFHLNNNELSCCECPKRFQKRSGQILKKNQFDILFKDTKQSNRHLVKSQKGITTQDCLCNYDAQTEVTLMDLDLTLMITILNNCCQKYYHPAVNTWISDIREKRNLIFHSGQGAFTEADLDKILSDLETLVLQISKQVPHQSFQTSIQAQILLLKSTAIQQERALNIIDNMECIMKTEKRTLINIITGKTDHLESTLGSLLKETLQHVEDGTADIKRHTEDLSQRQYEKSENMHTDLKENQKMIQQTQNDQTDTLKDIKHTTTETKNVQSRHTSALATIQSSVEELVATGFNEEDKEGFRTLKESFDKIKKLIGGCDVECQTDPEKEIEESRALLKSIRTKTDDIQTQIDHLKTQNDDIHTQTDHIKTQNDDCQSQNDHIRTQFDTVEKKLDTVMKSIETVHVLVDTVKSSSETVRKEKEHKLPNAQKVLETFLWKVTHTKAPTGANYIHMFYRMGRCKENPLNYTNMILENESIKKIAKEIEDGLKPDIKLYMNTMEELINHFVKDTMSQEATDEKLTSARSIAFDMKRKLKRVYKECDKLKIEFEKPYFSYHLKIYMEGIIAYFKNFEGYVDKLFDDADDTESTTHISMSRDNLSYKACNCFIDLFAYYHFFDYLFNWKFHSSTV